MQYNFKEHKKILKQIDTIFFNFVLVFYFYFIILFSLGFFNILNYTFVTFLFSLGCFIFGSIITSFFIYSHYLNKKETFNKKGASLFENYYLMKHLITIDDFHNILENGNEEDIKLITPIIKNKYKNNDKNFYLDLSKRKNIKVNDIKIY